MRILTRESFLYVLQEAYAELVKLAIERRTRLEESKKLWQFYWDMAEEENWIKEKENILSQADIGHDLTTVHLLLSKHKALEAEIHSHEPQLMSVASVGSDLIEQQQFGAEKVQERLQEITNLWQNLKNLSEYRKSRLTEAVDYHQVNYIFSAINQVIDLAESKIWCS